MAEAYLYYASGDNEIQGPWAGNYEDKADFDTNKNPGSEDSWDVWELVDNALDSRNAPKYNDPLQEGSCGKNYVFYISNGPNNDDNSGFTEARDILKAMKGYGSHPDSPPNYAEKLQPKDCPKNEEDNTNRFCLYPNNSQDTIADEWSWFMLRESPLNIITYAFDVQIVSQEKQCTGDPVVGWNRLMENMATEIPNKQTYFKQCGTAFDPDAFSAGLQKAFDGILSRNSVFASVALPAAANEQSTFLNNVYIGQFRPDQTAAPRWFGNLKQYKIGIVEDDDGAKVLQVVDADGDALVETVEEADNAGFVKGCARSFWTPVQKSETPDEGPDNDEYYWDYLARIDEAEENDAIENCQDEGDPAGSNTADGQIVEKGGQAYTLRETAPGSRNVWTWDCSSNDLDVCKNSQIIAFEDGTTYSAVLEAALDPNDSADRNDLINWAIGYDVDDEDEDGEVSEMRPTVHGDIVHSQPVAYDYAGDPVDPEIVVFYGGNDGMLRAINGNQDGTEKAGESHPSGLGVRDPGYEFWAFMPSEFFGEIKRLRTNDDAIKFPASGPTAGQGVAGSEPKGYGMDGPLSLYEFDRREDLDGDIELNLFAGMRRAGRAIYSFDVTDRTTPKLNWKIGCPSLDPNDPSGCTSGMEDIGQTWSRVSVIYAQGYLDDSGKMAPLILVGGGYDVCEDYDDGVENNNNCDSTKGNIIYLLDAVEGDVVDTFETTRSVPGNITIVPVSDDDPRIMYAYAVDMGGNVYRISGEKDGDPAIIGDIDPSVEPWIITKIASLGCDGVAPVGDNCTDGNSSNRKFLFGPDVIRLESGMFGVFAGTGDREKPLLDYAATENVTNYFYGLVDAPLDPDWLDGECGTGTICQSSLATLDPNDIADGVEPTAKGWRLELREGEQVVTGAITADNDVYFSTHIPTQPEACDADYGIATAYALNYFDGSGTDTEFLGGGLVPTPVAGKVIIDCWQDRWWY
jgi:type IV pilus assembly protein PilY1